LKSDLNEAQLKAATPKWQRILALRSFSRTSGRSVLDLAYQFCRSTPAIGVTLLGMRVQDHLRQNLQYYESPRLKAEEYLALRNLQEPEDQFMA